ncbi:MAG TPA: universal stress protein [Candidatus Sulfopaludibacter sp.]|nr:universal stress protein [Candidatus Sulfopaludibacter sp.]
MALLSKILVPVEFSPRCLGSAQYAEALACRFHSELVLLHVRAPSSLPYSAPDVMAYASVLEMDAGLAERLQAQLDEFPIQGPGGGPVTRVLLEGDPARAIVEFAQEGRFDLIVMPTHGYGPFRNFLLGSVTAKVLHDAQCPVWTGPHMESAPAYEAVSFHTIMCALDLQAESPAVLAWAGACAREFGGKLHIVHVIQTSGASAGGFHFDLDWRDELARQARVAIESLQAEAGTSGEVSIEIGETPAGIRDAAERLRADVLVIGRGRRAGMLGRLRTNAYAILREAPCPVAAV